MTLIIDFLIYTCAFVAVINSISTHNWAALSGWVSVIVLQATLVMGRRKSHRYHP